MPLSVLDLISGEGETVMMIKSLVNTVQSASSILQQVSAAGLGIRRQTGLQVINYLRGVAAPARTYVSYLTLNSLPNPARLPNSITRQLRNFAYHVVLTGFDPLTGAFKNQNITVSSNDLLTKQQALDIALSNAASNAEYYSIVDASGAVLSITNNVAGFAIP